MVMRGPDVAAGGYRRPTAPFVPQAGVVQQTVYNPQLGSPDLTGGANPRALADAYARQDPTGQSTPMYDLPPGRQQGIPGGLGMEGTYPVYDMPRGGYRNPAYDQLNQGDQGYNADQVRAGLPQGWQDAMGQQGRYSDEIVRFAPGDPRINALRDTYAAQQRANLGQGAAISQLLPATRGDAFDSGFDSPRSVDAQMWARNRQGYGTPMGDRLNQGGYSQSPLDNGYGPSAPGRTNMGDGAQLYGGDPAWADLAGVLGHDATQQIYAAGRAPRIGTAVSTGPTPTNLQATVGAPQQQPPPGGGGSGDAWQRYDQQGAPVAQQQQQGGRPWWQNYDLGTLAQLRPEQLQQLPPEVLDAMPNEFYTQHPEFMGRFTGQQVAQRGFAPEFAQNFQGGQPGQNVQPGSWLPSYQNLMDSGFVPQRVQSALAPMQSGGAGQQTTQPSTDKGEGLSPFLERPLGGVRPMAQSTYNSMSPTSQSALKGTLGYMGNFNQGQDYLSQTNRQPSGGPNVSVGQSVEAPRQRY